MTTATVGERPILFSGEMIQAILAGRKSMTRRVVKPQPPNTARSAGVISSKNARNSLWSWLDSEHLMTAAVVGSDFVCPYGSPRDRLWVRETWAPCLGGAEGPNNPTLYRADNSEYYDRLTWRSPIFMPRWASRITLEITDVRVQRLQEISEADARAEGVAGPGPGVVIPSPHDEGRGMQPGYSASNCGTFPTAVGAFRLLWDVLNERRGYPWASNPFVWSISFKKIREH